MSPDHETCLVEILDEQDLFTVDTEKIRTLCDLIMEDYGIRTGRIGVVLVDDDTIQQYNRDFLQHDFATDVISFPMERRLDEGYLEAEILACTGVAQRRASEFGWSPEDELVLYVVHGLLHAVGLDDIADEDRAEMRVKEREYLAKIEITVPDWDCFDWDDDSDSEHEA